MENSNSEGVVLPDISEAEQLASEHDGGENGESVVETEHQRVSAVSVRHAGVPTIVIQGDVSEGSTVRTPVSGPNYSWTKAASSPILRVRCKNTSAELHKNRFGSGGHGRCIKLDSSWYTPSEFEALSGRASSKDWKRSIQFQGRSLKTLIDEGMIPPHAINCKCAVCSDDESALDPVRLFTPYKRKQRKDDDSNKSTCGEDSDGDGDSDQSKEEALNSRDYQLMEPVVNSDLIASLKRLEDISSDLRKGVEELREALYKQCKVAALQPGGSSDSPLQSALDNDNQEKCPNCNREAIAKCALCLRTSYCSNFCQRKDWVSHQVECVRGVTTDANS